MGSAEGVSRPTTNSTNDTDQQTSANRQNFGVQTLMTSLQDHISNGNIHVVEVYHFPPTTDAVNIRCGDVIEFQINEKGDYDVFQVYKDGDEYCRIYPGYCYELFNINTQTPKNDRRMLLSIALNGNQTVADLHFCVISSSLRGKIPKKAKCSDIKGTFISFKIRKRELTIISLTDEESNQKFYLHKGDTIRLQWTSVRGRGYRIEEKKYCPRSAGLYTVEQTSHRTSSNGVYEKTFDEFGMSFLFRITDTNQIHDITVCIINDRDRIQHVTITDNDIRPNIIDIEQNDWVLFEWNTKHEQTITQIEPFYLDENKQELIKLKKKHEHFCWSNPTCLGYMYHQFTEIGVYYYKTENDQIGTIIVKPQINIHKVPLLNNNKKFIYEMNTKDFVQFNWNKIDSQDEPILITIDPDTSVVSDVTDHNISAFDCSVHKCVKIEPFFRHHFHTCETFLINIAQHGLYNFAYSNNPDNALISLIVENAHRIHSVVYDEENIFDPRILQIHRGDRVEFISSSRTRATIICRTDQYGNRLRPEKKIFQLEQNNIYHFMKEFSKLGIYYYSTNSRYNDRKRYTQDSRRPLTIIVLPEIRFHKKSIYKGFFNSDPIITTNTNDFAIWTFEKNIINNVILLRSNETFQEVILSHDRAVTRRSRQCLAVNCKNIPGGASFYSSLGKNITGVASFYSNPDFERVTGLFKDRLISTIIVDPPFSEHFFVVTDTKFVPHILYIEENDTVSWTFNDNRRNYRIYVRSTENNNEDDEDTLIEPINDRNTDTVYYLHTFNQSGEYIIKSDRFSGTATVIVYMESTVRNQNKRIQEPKIIEKIDHVSELGKQIHLDHENNRNATIRYTLDGSLPVHYNDNAHTYNPELGVRLRTPGFCILRAYSIEDRKISSFFINSRPTFVMGDERDELSWNSCKIKLLASSQHTNEIYGKIKIEPTYFIDRIDYFKIYIDDIEQKIIKRTDFVFPTDGYAVDKKYEIHVVAYPKSHIVDARPISSNRVLFGINQTRSGCRRTSYSSPRSITPNGPPTPSLSRSREVSNRRSKILLMQVHIGDHVSGSRTSSTIETIAPTRNNDEDNDNTNNTNLIEHQQLSIPTGRSTTQIELDVNVNMPKPKPTERLEEPNDETFALSNDANYRAEAILTKLTQAIVISST